MQSSAVPSPMPDERALMKHIARRVRGRRIILGHSQTTVAQLVGVTFQQLQKYERGMNRISATRLYCIAQALDTHITYFYEGFSPDQPIYPQDTAGPLHLLNGWDKLSVPVRNAIEKLLHAVIAGA